MTSQHALYLLCTIPFLIWVFKSFDAWLDLRASRYVDNLDFVGRG